MTLARLLATGSGSLAARLAIEGLAYELVSDPGMELTTADGRQRICCLPPMGKGIVIDERVNIPEAKLEAQGVSIRLFETPDEALAKCFAWQPDIIRYVSATLGEDPATDVLVTMLSTTGINVGDVVHLGTEALKVGSVSATQLQVQRAYWDTTAQKHWANEGGITYRQITNRPVRVRGRRARLYLYGGGDDLTGDGTQKWIGTVTSEPRLNEAGSVWMLQIDSIAKRLDAKWGADLDTPFRSRGVYYSAAAGIHVQIWEIVSGSGTPRIDVFTGFYETQRAFVEAFSTFLASMKTTYSLASTFRAVETTDGKWTLEVEVGTSVTGLRVFISSLQDGDTISTDDGWLNADGAAYGATFAAGDRIYPKWTNQQLGARMVPRGYFGTPASGLYADISGTATGPARRIYLSGIADPSWTSLSFEWSIDGSSREYQITAINTTSNYVELGASGDPAGNDPKLYTALADVLISPGRLLATGTLADLRDALVAAGPVYCNRAAAPFVTSGDIADWSDVVTARVGPLTSSRQWIATKAVDLSDVLTAEMQLLGVYPIIDANGKIGLAPIDIPNSAVAGATSIDEEIISVGWSDMERGGQTINRVSLKTGYAPKDDRWDGPPIDVVNIDAYADDHIDRAITVQPRSFSVSFFLGFAGTMDQFAYDDVAATFLPILGLFGYPYDIVTVHVSWKLFGVLLGDFVSFSAVHLPDPNSGKRPLDAAKGVVIGRKWALDEAHGTLTILLSRQSVSGYAPTARVTARSQIGSSDTWDLTVNPTLYAPDADHSVDTFFAAGDAVRLIEYDSESPTVATGMVGAVDTSAHVITVSFDAAWTPGSKTWEICYDRHDQVAETQMVYAYIADAFGVVDDENARTFAP